MAFLVFKNLRLEIVVIGGIVSLKPFFLYCDHRSQKKSLRAYSSAATDSGQKYSDASSFLYIFHSNLQLKNLLFWSQFMSDFDNFLIDTRKIESS